MAIRAPDGAKKTIDGDDTEDDDDLQIPVRHETQENISLLESPRCQGKKCALDGKAENED